MSADLFKNLRHKYHRKILAEILGKRPNSDAYSNADSHSEVSKAIAARMARRLARNVGVVPCTNPPDGQSAGKIFVDFTKDFLDDAFRRLCHLRPGSWIFSTSQASVGIGKYYQYEHLSELTKVIEQHPELKSALGGDYLVIPDIVIAREPVADREINTREELLVEGATDVACYAPLRSAVNDKNILHASISCKWTIRSDRAQNTRTEALNLIRNRKGKAPIVVAVTLEPMPTRIASIAMGTGDLDCTYHGALPELFEAVREVKSESQYEVLNTLVNGRRLRDISDLPFDLAT
ncbi:MAG TPA: NgoMIV family type II restriction endonuclease [Terriglobia bacterium]|nr:NgoMIV family type II restriction endonuclease [Terriglobia bacterium]